MVDTPEVERKLSGISWEIPFLLGHFSCDKLYFKDFSVEPFEYSRKFWLLDGMRDEFLLTNLIEFGGNSRYDDDNDLMIIQSYTDEVILVYSVV